MVPQAGLIEKFCTTNEFARNHFVGPFWGTTKGLQTILRMNGTRRRRRERGGTGRGWMWKREEEEGRQGRGEERREAAAGKLVVYILHVALVGSIWSLATVPSICDVLFLTDHSM